MSEFSVPFPDETGLPSYLREIAAYPMLDSDTEHDLAVRWRDQRDSEAARQLAESYLRLVVSIARGYRGYGLPLGDLIAEGNVGLMEAIKRFDPEKGARLGTYAPWWIRAAIHDYVMRWASIVRMGTSNAQKRLFFNLRRMAAAEGQLEDFSLSQEAARRIAERLGVSEADVIDMHQRLTGKTHSLNASKDDEGDLEFQDLLVDDTPHPEAQLAEAEELAQRRGHLAKALTTLNERERDILVERRLKDKPVTLEELGNRYGVTRERVRQIEFRAFNKLQSAMMRISSESGSAPTAAN